MKALAIRHVAFEDLGWFEPVLAARGIELQLLDAGVDALPAPEACEADLLIVLGGPLSVHDRAVFPFLEQTQQLLRARLLDDRACLGICLGAQLMAAALGGVVSKMPQKEIGWGPIELTEDGRSSALGELGGSCPVLHWHGEECSLPDGARLLASNPQCRVQAFAWRKRGLALQFHLEAQAHKLERWYVGHICELEQVKLPVPQLRSQAERYAESLRPRCERFFERWLQSCGL